MQKRINVSLTQKQYEAVKRNAAALEVKPGTWCKMAILNSAGIQYSPDILILPKKIKQTELFKKGA